ncbi:MAG: protein kinase [Bryobacterales bacterium]|nr:protein kinase [Bryobacterales bacterium]
MAGTRVDAGWGGFLYDVWVATPAPVQIAHYQVTGTLGEGGMGVVYRATDTKLGRDVALKVLAAGFAEDPERLARFAREARVLASLNHPGIAAVYGVEENALVMELVEGPTLEDRIAQGAIGVDEALPLIEQLIDAIEYAHEKGVVHRDLKPANIKVTGDGRLKVLDFGLAKALADDVPAGTASQLANSPTLVARSGTVAGMILGTAAYMAPEQARGKAVDKRADIWAFGVVAYEMLTGRRLFEGETVSDVLAQTLTKPVELAAVPDRLRGLVGRCMQREPRLRLRDIGDARLLLEVAPAPVQVAARPSRLPWFAAAALAISTVVLGTLWMRSTRIERSPSGPVAHFNLPEVLSAAFSPDGSSVAWGGASSGGRVDFQIQVRALADVSVRSLPGTEGAITPFWSADGQAIGFFAGDRMKAIRLSDGEVRVLGQAPEPEGATWQGTLTRGRIVFVSGQKLQVMELPSASLRTIPVTLPAGEVPFAPQFLPEGNGFVFLSAKLRRPPFRVLRSSLEGGTPVELLQSGGRVGFGLHPRSAVWHMFHVEGQSAGPLFATPVNARLGTPTGARKQVLSEVGALANTVERNFHVAARGGAILYRRRRGSVPVWKPIWYDRNGTVLGSIGAEDATESMHLSPDEKRVVLSTGRDPERIRVVGVDDGKAVTLASSDRMGDPLWSPDGRFLYYLSASTDGRALLRHDVSGSIPAETVSVVGRNARLADISPDGRTILLSNQDQPARLEYLDLPASGTASARPIELRNPGPEPWYRATFSPGGKWIAVEDRIPGMIFLPWPAAREPNGWIPRQSLIGMLFLFFHPSGQELCGLRRETGLHCAKLSIGGDGPRLDAPVRLFAAETGSRVGARIAQWSKDGKRLLILATDKPEQTSTRIVTGWTSLLETSEAEGK